MPSTSLAYTLVAPIVPSSWTSALIGVGSGPNSVFLFPNQPQNNSYWIVILDAQKPGQKVQEWVVPASNAVAPSGIETYMQNPNYLFAVVTQQLYTWDVPLDGFYNFLATYGAGAQLQRLEQLHSVLNYGNYAQAGYILTGGCGPRTPTPPPSYELSGITGLDVMMLKSLESMPNGNPPYSIADTYTWIPRME